MPAQKRVKKEVNQFRIVGVISSAAELTAAIRMSAPPDLFEVRLDCVGSNTDLEARVRKLSAPVIITARHPAEGGMNNLTEQERRELFMRFLPLARYVDVELRSVRTLRTVLERAQRTGV